MILNAQNSHEILNCSGSISPPMQVVNRLAKMHVLRRALCGLMLLFSINADRYQPYIIPDGYNSSLNGDPVEFMCEAPNDTYNFLWDINGKTIQEIGLELLAERGIVSDYMLVREDNRSFTVIGIDPRVENNNTRIFCVAQFSDTAPLTSAAVTFRIQGLLDPPTALEIVHHNATHQVLRWTPPFTLDLTAYEDDITGYSVTLEMESPPPRDPYDLSVSRDLLDSTTNFTWSLSGTSTEFFFPRYAFPVWLSVRAENPVGLGAPSPLLHYSPPTSTGDCTRLKDLVSDRSIESKVKFNNSTLTPTVEILLYRVQSKNDVCIDSVMVTLSAGNDTGSTSRSGSGGEKTGGTSQEVLMPVVRETEIIVVLEPHLLDPHTHYTATLSLQQQHFSTAHFSTHHVQKVTVKEEEGNGLVVECVFAEGSPHNTTCTVVVEGEGGRWVETFRGPLAFPHLSTGTYTVTVYDGEMEDQEPAVVTVAEVSGVSPSTTSTPTFTSDGTTLNPAVADHSKSGRASTDVVALSVGMAALFVALTSILGVTVLCLFRRMKSKVIATSASNVIYDEVLPVIVLETNAAYATTSAITTAPNAAYATTATGRVNNDEEYETIS
ncbi:hypothetical protein GBAR_LOCUS5340 [Geodia barretti]|uniref:Ig-like domain-containing protein n=1 Tax=Geodia barretti TaxID=519541 RepID=A0AA35W4D2_GEOBA|nr:hypothetical protein GBAR_LOCUS5340 [Geodia barretti]